MIDRGEILEVASMRRLRPDVIEKDYVLGWVLAGIFSHPVLGPAWAFKGGTCLKKCYVETYLQSCSFGGRFAFVVLCTVPDYNPSQEAT